jgi:hypothetical protein
MEVDQRRRAFFYPNGVVSNTEQILHKIVSTEQKGWPTGK